ncbi:MAG TPA: hypothetical protein VN711_02335, partial [Candidatus Saccharimonadales bacterium]|nr:hypothetical protein [Candidatus Saccharimonadales bacterium]
MDQTTCFICERTNHIPETEMVAIVTFSQSFHAKNALFAVEKSHIIPSQIWVYAKNEIKELNSNRGQFLETETVVFQMHGIADIVHLQMLYMESICRENKALTFDISLKNPFVSL